MTIDANSENDSRTEPSVESPTTVPDNYCMSFRGFDNQGAKQFSEVLSVFVRELSRHIDLSSLDGVTVAHDYAQALSELDRGCQTSCNLTPSREMARGVAMTPAVMRDGKVRSHIVLDAEIMLPLADPESDGFGLALHLLAHECAHVEVKHRFDRCFPGVVLQKKFEDAHKSVRWQVIDACWNEYIVTYIVASIGDDPTEDYEETFLVALKETRSKANNFIKAFRDHRAVVQVAGEVYGAYGELMRYASYLLGTMAGKQLTLSDLPKATAALEGHWFSRFFEKLGRVQLAIAANYGKWDDLKIFEALGDLADEIVSDGGVILSYRQNGQLYANIPFSPETM